MPEGDSVWRTARVLDRVLVDQRLVESDFRVPALATLDLTGSTCLGTDTHGKHLFTRFRGSDRVLTVHSHLGMDGAWRAMRVGPGTPPRSGGAHHQVRALLRTETAWVIGSSLKALDLLSPDDEQALRSRLGPDLLAADTGEAEAMAAWQAAVLRDPGRPFAETLLDQRVLAGLGTVFVSEVGFLLGVAPTRPVAEASATRVVSLARQLLRSSVRQGRRVTTGNTRRGADLWVYGRDRRPCRRCATPVRHDPIGTPPVARSIWWCPSCQT